MGQSNSSTATAAFTSSTMDIFRSSIFIWSHMVADFGDLCQLVDTWPFPTHGSLLRIPLPTETLIEISPEGIESLCADVQVDHTDVRILMLAWKMKAEKQGYFTLEEWTRGLKSLRADTLNKLKKALPELEEVKRPSNFVDFYAYAFRYCLTEEKQKSIDIESICQLLDLVLGPHFRPQVDYFVEYLKIQSDYKVINMDQWMGFFRFCNEISFPDPNNYDAGLAWPLALDNFVEWMRAKQA